MTFTFALDAHDSLRVTLRDAEVETSVAARPALAAAATLRRALEEAGDTGYGECFWPGSEGGQYWWIFKRADETVDVVALWTRGGVAIWEHVFRATDAFAWVVELFDSEVARLRLRVP